MNKFFLFLASTAALIFLLLFLISSRGDQITSALPHPFIIKSFSTPTVSPWQTYVNNHNFYSLDYPRGWEKTEWEFHEATQLNQNRGPQEGMIWQQAIFQGSEQSFQVIIWVNRQKAAIPQWLRWYRHEDLDLKKIPEKSNYRVLNKDAYLIFQEKTSWGYPAVRIFLPEGERIFELVIQTPTETPDKVYQEMIASFKLLERE